MLFDRDYKTIASPVEAVYMSSKSRFLAFAFPVGNELEIKNILSDLKSQYPDATHHCYAWILHPDKSAQRMNDDGEPAGTAGRPILKQINALGLTNTLLVIVRYFGGKKLGIPGLIAAYGQAASLCLSKAAVIQKTLLDHFLIRTGSEREHEIYNLARRFSAVLKIREDAGGQNWELAMNGSKTEAFLRECKKMDNFEIEYLKSE